MTGLKPPVDPGIYLLADHLDAALAAGEDLLAAALAAPADIDREAPDTSSGAIAAFANDLKRLEASIAARVLQARRRAAELPRLDPVVRGIINLFMTSTESALDLVDHFAKLRDGGSIDPSDLMPYAVLRSRGLLAPDAAELPRYQTVTISESYQIGGLLPLGSLMDVVSTTLDALDLHFDLYLDVAARAAALEATAPEPNNALLESELTRGAADQHPEVIAIQPSSYPDAVTRPDVFSARELDATAIEARPAAPDFGAGLSMAAPGAPEAAEPSASAAQSPLITRAVPMPPAREALIARAVPVAPALPGPSAMLTEAAAAAVETGDFKKQKSLAEALAFLEKPPASPSPGG